jgi:hypothetical protein
MMILIATINPHSTSSDGTSLYFLWQHFVFMRCFSYEKMTSQAIGNSSLSINLQKC